MSSRANLGFNATWSMAVGGMIGGGIFSTLGVVIAISGGWAWASFLAAGLIAVAAGYSYIVLADLYEEGGGAFTFLREAGADGFAGGLSWVLLAGYILTNAVYAFTFGRYLGNVVGLGSWFPRTAGVGIVAVFVLLNLRGVGEAGKAEIILVWFKLVVLIGLAGWGLSRWEPTLLSSGVPDSSPGTALFGAASVFMAYEGFQLLTYDYEDIEDPSSTLRRAVLSAIGVVIVVYLLVAVGAAMLIGAGSVVEHKEVALALAGKEAIGTFGLVLVTIAAAFSTGSAINATLFATARLAHRIAQDDELPSWFAHRNREDIPDRAMIALGVAAGLLAAIGSLSVLVEGASLAFLFTFAVVGGLAWRERAGVRAITGFGAVTAAAAAIVLTVRLARTEPIALVFLSVLVVVATAGRSFVLNR